MSIAVTSQIFRTITGHAGKTAGSWCIPVRLKMSG